MNRERPPVALVFGVHLHQPVGNFDEVFAAHLRDAYLPLLARLAARRPLRLTLHISGPLLEWLGAHDDGGFLEQVARLVAADRAELLLSGYDEPILAALDHADRLDQIERMRRALRRRFGVSPRGLWLTERVWEPDLASDLAQAGITHVLVDDRHLLVSGFSPDEIHAPFFTEHQGQRVALLPIDEQLRYLVPFRPPDDVVAYLDTLRDQGRRLAVLVDDGEKFGGWPGTAQWVYRDGWLDTFLDRLTGLVEAGALQLFQAHEAVERLPSGGLAYLPATSYRELEVWALWPAAAVRLRELAGLVAETSSRSDVALLRGAHWRNFLTRYPEANRMHKKAQQLSELCRRCGNPPHARRLIGRAQCNDAYWHGVFGGLYLPHLRHEVWRNLARAEALLRRNEGLECEIADFDCDGNDEILLHSASFAALVSPARGGALEELTRFDVACNYAAVLTRREEAYHRREEPTGRAGNPSGAPSIHDLEECVVLPVRPVADPFPRSLCDAWVIPPEARYGDRTGSVALARETWATTPMTARIRRNTARVRITLRPAAACALDRKDIVFDREGRLVVELRWKPELLPAGALVEMECSLASDLPASGSPGALEWSYPITTVSMSERGAEETRQGTARCWAWPTSAGSCSLTIG